MLAKRLISAFIGIALLVPTLIYLQGLSMILVYGVMIISLFEFFTLFSSDDETEPPFVYLFNCFFFLMLLDYMDYSKSLTLFLLLLVTLSTFLFFHKKLSSMPLYLGMNLLACLYIILPLFHFILFLRMPSGQFWLMMILAATWMGDSGAYLFGNLWGKHKLYPRISPGKTWEGLCGQILGAIAGAFLWKSFFMPTSSQPTLRDTFVVAIIAAVLGPLGDLCESMFKRAFNKKDSGTLMPGHGGLLDRIDGVLFTGPAFYYYLSYLRG